MVGDDGLDGGSFVGVSIAARGVLERGRWRGRALVTLESFHLRRCESVEVGSKYDRKSVQFDA